MSWVLHVVLQRCYKAVAGEIEPSAVGLLALWRPGDFQLIFAPPITPRTTVSESGAESARSLFVTERQEGSGGVKRPAEIGQLIRAVREPGVAVRQRCRGCLVAGTQKHHRLFANTPRKNALALIEHGERDEKTRRSRHQPAPVVARKRVGRRRAENAVLKRRRRWTRCPRAQPGFDQIRLVHKFLSRNP